MFTSALGPEKKAILSWAEVDLEKQFASLTNEVSIGPRSNTGLHGGSAEKCEPHLNTPRASNLKVTFEESANTNHFITRVISVCPIYFGKQMQVYACYH